MNKSVKSTCCYCGVGCGLLIDTEDGQIVGVRGDPDHPANAGRLCTKGASLHLTALPTIACCIPNCAASAASRGSGSAGTQALDHAAERFAGIIRAHGPDSVAFYVSGQLLTEDYYVFNKLAKGLIGTNNVDTNSRLCMSSAVAGYKQTLGADAPPCCYEDIAAADCLLIAGANPAVAHPIVFPRIEDARAANPDLRIIVIDPRRSESAAIADLHLALKPGTDIALYNGLLNVMLAEGLVDRQYIAAHTEGFAALAESSPPTRRHRGRRSAASPSRHRAAARWFGSARRRAVALLPGTQPVGARHAQQRGADPPASGNRPDRPPRRRTLLADRPAERHGRPRSRRPGQPAVGPPRPRQPRAPRRSGAPVGRAVGPGAPGKTAVELFAA
jgi:assimilatory nitrate reductase catalytic subunit